MVKGRRYSTSLREEVRRKLEKMGTVDIVVGIPAYFSDETVDHVMKAVSEGLHRYFPGKKALIIVADGGSTDDTREVARGVDVTTFDIEKIVGIYRGLPGKGTALRSMFEAGVYLKAAGVAVFDSDLESITPEWVRAMLKPVLEDSYDYVAPNYRRYKFDGTITNTVVYNLTRTLYGKDIRQPIGGDFGCSQALVKRFLEDDVWDTDIAKFGVDIWMTTTAVVDGFSICEAALGAKIHGEKDPAEDLKDMFLQVVGTIFTLMEDFEDTWKRVKGSEPVPVVGEAEGEEPTAFDIDLDRLIEYFKVGRDNFDSIWKQIVDDEDYETLERLADETDHERFVLPCTTWVRILYRYASVFRVTPMQKFKLLGTLVPIYNLRVASLVNELSGMSPDEAETYYDEQAQTFEDMKDYLIRVWDDPRPMKSRKD